MTTRGQQQHQQGQARRRRHILPGEFHQSRRGRAVARHPQAEDLRVLSYNIHHGEGVMQPILDDRSSDEQRDALLLEAQALPTVEERAPLYQEATQLIADQFIYVFFNHTLWLNAFAENVRGVCERTAPDGTLLKCETNGRNWFSSIWLQ